MTRICGTKTVSGHGCMNPVSDGGDHCSAGHQCVPVCQGECIDIVAGHWEASFEAEQLVVLAQSQPKIGVEWHQQQVAPFDNPEFYDPGLVAFVRCGDEVIGVADEGERCWERASGLTFPAMRVQEAEEFQKAVPGRQAPNRW